VHRAIRLVAEGAASLPLVAAGAGAARAGDLLALLARTNPRESGTHLLLDGAREPRIRRL